MTQQQKKMKQYCNAIERRLNLPRDIRNRVMDDFASAVQERREAGLTDEEIYAEFGTPKEAAAELNQQMREYAYRKSPWRWVFLGAAVLSGLWLLVRRLFLVSLNILAAISFPSEAHSVGIIGGADGPTAVFITRQTGTDWDLILMGILLVVSVLAFLRLRKCKQK